MTGSLELAPSELASYLLPAGDTIGRAQALLQRARHDVVVVVDDEGRVIGTVTDSTIRRAAIEGQSFGAPVATVMSPDPVIVRPETDEAEVASLWRSHRLRSLPVVEEGRLVGIRSLEGFPDSTSEPVALVMAGGRGQRLRPFTDKVPKPLLKVGSMSIVERLIRGVAEAGVRTVFLAVNYMAEVFEQRLGSGGRLGVHIHYVREAEPMGTAGALSLLPPGEWGPILVANGDIVTTVDFARMFDFHWHHGGALTVSGVEHRSPIPYGVLHTAGPYLLRIEEKPERRDLCSAGLYVLDGAVRALLPAKIPLDMPELVAAILAEGLPVHVFPVLERWFDIGGPAEFERVLLEFALGEED